MKKLVMTVIVLSCMSPAMARSYSHVDSAAKTNTRDEKPIFDASLSSAQDKLLKGTEFEYVQHDADLPAGVDNDFPTWHWYWDEKAQIDTKNKHGFWGNDAVGKFLAGVTNCVIVPVWNAVMKFNLTRVVLPVVALMSLGLPTTLLRKRARQG